MSKRFYSSSSSSRNAALSGQHAQRQRHTHTMRGNDAVRQKQKISRKETRDSIPSAATFNLAAIRMCEMCISEGKQDIAMAKMIAMKDNIRMHDSYRILDQCMHLLDCKKRRKDSKWISMHTDVGTHTMRGKCAARRCSIRWLGPHNSKAAHRAHCVSWNALVEQSVKQTQQRLAQMCLRRLRAVT